MGLIGRRHRLGVLYHIRGMCAGRRRVLCDPQQHCLDGNASLTQTAFNVGPGTYAFGAYVSYATDAAGGNFDQGQISLTAEGPGTFAVVGFDPNALNGQFTIPGGAGFSFTPWFLLSGILTYSGPGDAPFLLNINVQDFSETGGLVLDVDNAFITAVPTPATLPLFASGLGLLAVWAWPRRKRKLLR